MMKSVKPWKADSECQLEGFSAFKEELNRASYHNAAEVTGEMKQARSCVRAAAEIAIDQRWPYWAMERMFREIGPLVDWTSYMTAYINLLHDGYQNN